MIASHSHPQISKGGAEIAAFQLFTALQSVPQYDTWFLGCLRDQRTHKPGATISQPYSDREYLYSAAEFDWFKFSNRDCNFPREFRILLRELRPQILHFHHFINFGLEAFLHVRETLPDCKIILTLHEYLALCHHFGQMITKRDRTLCYESSPTNCAECFRDIAPSDFFLRKLYIRRFFDLVDQFICPSAFLAERYMAWGVPSDRITIIENVIPRSRVETTATNAARRSDLLRVGFFGQVSFLKGMNVLFETAELLAAQGEHNIYFEIYGDYGGQPPEFQTEFVERLAKTSRNAKFLGRYDQTRIDKLMRSVDVVLIPSIWWENSPVVIQEALRNRIPIICSNIGGMAEKVRDGLDGFHFPVGNSIALASLLVRLAEAPELLQGITETMRSVPASDDIVARHEHLYRSLIAAPAS
jgi:glycosyltransferase involved in cell wall biosynthesis